MNSGSWSSYRASMSLECFGEPDEDGDCFNELTCCGGRDFQVVEVKYTVGYPKDCFAPGDPPENDYREITESILSCKKCNKEVDRW